LAHHCTFNDAAAITSAYSRGEAAPKREYRVWKMREAHFPHSILPLASAAGASTQGERAKLLSIRHALRLKRKFAILKGMLRDE